MRKYCPLGIGSVGYICPSYFLPHQPLTLGIVPGDADLLPNEDRVIDFLLSPPSLITIIVVVILTVVIALGAVIASDTNGEYPLALATLLGMAYLLWHAGAWLIARFMNTVQSYR
jgi:hypothetical protein